MPVRVDSEYYDPRIMSSAVSPEMAPHQNGSLNRLPSPERRQQLFRGNNFFDKKVSQQQQSFTGRSVGPN